MRECNNPNPNSISMTSLRTNITENVHRALSRGNASGATIARLLCDGTLPVLTLLSVLAPLLMLVVG
jgi:hypothetical protein